MLLMSLTSKAEAARVLASPFDLVLVFTTLGWMLSFWHELSVTAVITDSTKIESKVAFVIDLVFILSVLEFVFVPDFTRPC